MKKILIASLVATLALSACQKQETPKPDTPTEQSTQTAPADQHNHEHKEGEHDHDHHDHEGEGHNHTHHSHDGHDHHHHHEGDVYQCGDKKINIVVHNHEGEMEVHATIDDIEYDLPADANKPNTYTNPEEGLNNQGMALSLAGDKATFSSLDGKNTLLECAKTTDAH